MGRRMRRRAPPGAPGRCAPGAPAVCQQPAAQPGRGAGPGLAAKKLLAAGQDLGLPWGAAGAMDGGSRLLHPGSASACGA